MSSDTLEGGSKKGHKRKHRSLLVVPDDALALEVGTTLSRRRLFEQSAPQQSGSSEDAGSGMNQPEHVADTYRPTESDDAMAVDTEPQDDEETTRNIVYIVDPKRTVARRIYAQDRRLLNEQRERYWRQHLPILLPVYLELKRRRSAGEALDIGVSGPAFTLSVTELLDPRTSRSFNRKHEDEHAVVALMRYGYMACTPAQPALAIGLHALEFYHQLRRQHPRLGLQPYARALCRISNISYSADFRAELSDAFDAYLMLLRAVDDAVNGFLGRNSPGWRVKNSCPACTFKTEGEPALPAGRLWAMDGNGSLKRHANAGSAQTRELHSDYLLTAEQVDVYKDQVRPQTAPSKKTDLVQGAEPGDGAEEPVPCVSHWKNLQPEHMKRALTQFEQTGAFVSACRHGFILWWAEMIRSGELAKYGLAHVGAMLEHAVDKSQRTGYDIGCGFETTLHNSILGGQVTADDLRTLVGIFHGHAHNRLCQLTWHPLIFEGIGLEDFETCERVFFESNEVARVVRYASLFHYRQAIDLHWRQHDAGRYEELSRWLVRRFWHAYQVQKSSNAAVEDAQKTLGFGPDDYKQWVHEEREYLTSLRKEPEHDVLAMSYVEALQAVEEAKKKYEATHVEFASITAEHYALGPDAVRALTSTFTRAETARRNAQKKYTMALETARVYEAQVGAEKTWDATSDEWKRTIRYARERKYRLALDHLERLVVQRLLELTKANMSGVCYKQRVQIARALKTRSAAIRAALDRYNDAARELDATTIPLEWDQVVTWTELQDFTLLRFARRDIRERPWAQAANRLLMNQYFKSVRAQEELDRVRVEVRRLRAYVDHDDRELATALSRAEQQHLPLAAELRSMHQYRQHVNAAHRERLDTLTAYEAFKGPPEPPTASSPQQSSTASWPIDTSSRMPSVPSPPTPEDFEEELDEEEMLTQEDELERILLAAEHEPVVDELAPMFLTWSIA